MDERLIPREHIRRALIAAGALGALAAALYIVPRVLDWDRYRAQISSLAADRLGWPVSIQGSIGLTILPEPVLTAGQISVTDPITGAVFSAQEMRLQVGFLGLLAGRIDPKALDLDNAEGHLPWPLPHAGLVPRPPSAFAATIRDGTFFIGAQKLSNVNGRLATDGETGGARINGTARFQGVNWVIDANLVSTGAGDQATLEANFTGQNAAEGAMLQLDGQFSGEGSFSGNLSASGPDLSRLMPAPAVPFGAEAKITLAGSQLSGSDLTLELNGASGHGAFRWQSADPAFTLQLATTRLDLDRWQRVWNVAPTNSLSSRFDLTANAAQLAGATLRDVHLDLERNNTLTLRDFTATLPGETAFTARGKASFDGQDWHIDQGNFTVRTADITPSVSWLAAANPDIPSLPGWAPLSVHMAGQLRGTVHALSVTGLQGTLGNVPVSGSLAFAHGTRTQFQADLKTDQLAIASLAALNLSPNLDYDLKIAAGSASLGPITARALGFHLTRDQNGSRLFDASANVAGANVTGSYNRAADGTVTYSTIDAAAPSLAPLLALLPGGWRGTSALAALPLTLHATFKGPALALSGNIDLTAGSTRLSILPVIDLTDQTASGAVTLQDPGAWRLIQRLGGPDVSGWVGVGSLGLLARFNAKAGHVGFDYLDLALGGMRVKGNLALDLAGDNWALNGALTSDRLPLAWPRLADATPIPTAWVQGGSGKITLDAKTITANDTVVASSLHADLALANGVLSIGNVAVNWGAGSIQGNATWRALDPEPSLNLSANFKQIALNGPVTGGRLDLLAGDLTGQISLDATGHTPTTMLSTLGGQIDLTVDQGKLVGFDLAKAQAATALPGTYRPQTALLAALKAGTTNFNQLHIAATIKDGGLSIDNGTLQAGSNVTLTGIADLPGGALDIGLALQLPGQAPPVAARYKGNFAAPGVTVDMAGFKKWLVQRGKVKRVIKAK